MRLHRSMLRRPTILLSALTLLALLVGPAVAGHVLSDKPLDFNQQSQLPITAATYSSQTQDCPGVNLDTQDGWVFIHPPNRGGFTHITANFTSGTQTFTSPNTGDHTNVSGNKVTFATPAGATLNSVTARGVTSGHDFFNLTHVCVARPTHSILLIKRDHLGNLLGGAAFKVTGPLPGTTDHAMTQNPTGVHCVDGLAAGTYSVTETVTPPGYQPNTNIPNVTATSTQTCAQRIAGLSTPPANTDADIVVTNEPTPRNLTVTKRKITMDAQGNLVNSTTPLSGFTFALYAGTDTTQAPLATSTTGAGGTTSFAPGILEVGNQYTVCETGVPAGQENYWTAANPACQTFTTQLGQDVSLFFHNAPKADVRIQFFDVTTYTSAEIECRDSANNVIGTTTIAANTGGGTLNLNHLNLGDYDCKIKIRNGVATTP